jgi:hypothetical protein
MAIVNDNWRIFSSKKQGHDDVRTDISQTAADQNFLRSINQKCGLGHDGYLPLYLMVPLSHCVCARFEC